MNEETLKEFLVIFGLQKPMGIILRLAIVSNECSGIVFILNPFYKIEKAQTCFSNSGRWDLVDSELISRNTVTQLRIKLEIRLGFQRGQAVSRCFDGKDLRT